ncbi:hypothetical protein EYF80_020138 [Liparis tanakae]|uniref:Uncharacterized protein n=1 Tax=Liparis tanakae TaxID=230148 RepID=A0A4Z2HVF4_9TELE|nr:hypothetical protein EYF80_020138 [Liparis tanakae]
MFKLSIRDLIKVDLTVDRASLKPKAPALLPSDLVRTQLGSKGFLKALGVLGAGGIERVGREEAAEGDLLY